MSVELGKISLRLSEISREIVELRAIGRIDERLSRMETSLAVCLSILNYLSTSLAHNSIIDRHIDKSILDDIDAYADLIARQTERSKFDDYLDKMDKTDRQPEVEIRFKKKQTKARHPVEGDGKS